jgi:hypothetical protein
VRVKRYRCTEIADLFPPNNVFFVAEADYDAVVRDRDDLLRTMSFSVAVGNYTMHADTCMRRQIGTVSEDPECTCGLGALLCEIGGGVTSEERYSRLTEAIEKIRDEMCDTETPDSAWTIYWINRLDSVLSQAKK